MKPNRKKRSEKRIENQIVEERKIKDVKGYVLDRPAYVEEYKAENEEWRDNYVGHPPNGNIHHS